MAEAGVDAGGEVVALCEAFEEAVELVAFLPVETGAELVVVGGADLGETGEEPMAVVGEVELEDPSICRAAHSAQHAAFLQVVEEGDEAAGHDAEGLGDVLLALAGCCGDDAEQPDVGWDQTQLSDPLGVAVRRCGPQLGEQESVRRGEGGRFWPVGAHLMIVAQTNGLSNKPFLSRTIVVHPSNEEIAPMTTPSPERRSSSPRTPARVEVGGLLVATAGVVIQFVSQPDDFPVVPPGAFVLAAAAAAVALGGRWRWSPLIGVAVAAVVSVGGFLSDPGFADNLTGSAGSAVGAAVLIVGLITTIVAGVLAVTRGDR